MSGTSAPPQTLLICGGTRSGKSALALRWAEAHTAQRMFVATARPLDEETALRVARHQGERGPGWTTHEEPLNVLAALREVSRPGVAVVVDCMTMWLANLLEADALAGQESVLSQVQKLAAWLPHAPGPVVLVTAEVGMGIVPVSSAGRAFRDIQGEVNQVLAHACSTVLFASCGLPLALKNSIPKELL